jgi:hypothetical protein
MSDAPVKDDGDREVIRQWVRVAEDEVIDFIIRLHKENIEKGGPGLLDKIHAWYQELYTNWSELKERYDDESSGK